MGGSQSTEKVGVSSPGKLEACPFLHSFTLAIYQLQFLPRVESSLN